MTVGNSNESWGKTVVDQLIQLGVDYFCLAPGFRSTPLALAIAENSAAKTFVHFDERGLGFHALGYAKAAKKPAVIIVTSGTAVGNLLPCVMEASESQVPLILLTCDRPAELRDTMANQTTDQIKIFGNFVRYFFDLPSPQPQLPKRFLATTISQAVARCQYPIKGPVQLNCAYPEPFFDEQKGSSFEITPTQYTLPCLSLSEEETKKWGSYFEPLEKGVIVLGGYNGSEFSAIQDLAQKLGWPIFPDILSSFRTDGSGVNYYHHIVKSLPDLKADCILHFGDAFVSKILLQWMGRHKDIPIIHVSEHPKRCDPLHFVTKRVVCDPEIFARSVSSFVTEKKNNWLKQWREWSQLAEQALFSLLEEEKLSEPKVVKVLEEALDPEQALFLGNSMPIRDANMFFSPKRFKGPIFGNRGLSGIDGNIATCAGMAQTQSVLAVLGDQTFLHDLNSLAQLKKTKYPVQIVLINNGGGGIFSFVAIGKREDVLDPFFAAAHDKTFEKAAEFFELPYCRAENATELCDALKTKRSTLIEVQTNRKQNLAFHQKIDQKMAEALCSFSTVS